MSVLLTIPLQLVQYVKILIFKEYLIFFLQSLIVKEQQDWTLKGSCCVTAA